MEPTQNQPNPVPTAPPVLSPPASSVSSSSPLPPGKPVLLGNKLKDRFNSFPKNTKIFVIVMGVTFLVLFVLVLFAAAFGKKKNVPQIIPTASPVSESPQPEVILNASRYATDSGVLKIESDLKDFQKQLDIVDVKQTDLSLPNLDFNIKFDQ